MTIVCTLPDGDVGVALRLSEFLRCQSQALGENGFQALAGGPLVMGLLSALVTLFVAMIGYRLILGRVPDMADGIGWAIRLGLVLALATAWPAFQTLVYRVAVETPRDLAGILLPASGLSAEGLDARVQQAYDGIRLGSTTANITAFESERQAGADRPTGTAQPGAQPPVPSFSPLGQAALPQTASWFVVSTLGMTGALSLAMGFLLAIGPLMIMALLFDATIGVFVGWIRALLGATLALTAGTIVTALDLLMVESELAHLQSVERGVSIIDPQALTTIILAFTLAMLGVVWAAVKTAGGLTLRPSRIAPAMGYPRRQQSGERRTVAAPGAAARIGRQNDVAAAVAVPARAQGMADALAGAVRREQSTTIVADGSSRNVRRLPSSMREDGDTTRPQTALGPSGRRALGRRTRSASRRDGAK